MSKKNDNSLKNLVKFKKGESGNLKGRPKGRRNKKTILKELLSIKISHNDAILEVFRKQFPNFFPEGNEITVEELIFIRLIKESILSEKPISYMKELFDRVYGKVNLDDSEEAEEAQVLEWDNRMKILQEQLLLTENDSNDY